MPRAKLLTLLVSAALATPALAQETSDAAETPAAAGAIVATLSTEVLKPELDADGQPILDASGQPTLSFQPVSDGAALLPGDEFRYTVAFENKGADAEAVHVALDLPAGARLLPETVDASIDSDFQLASSADPERREPLFIEVDDAQVPNPDWVEAPERFDQLIAEIDRIASETTVTVTYALVVR